MLSLPRRGALSVRPRCLSLLLCAGALAACAPALDWRDVRPDGSGMLLQFPCKPQRQERNVALAGPPLRLALLACTADGQTWALAFADVANPARVGPALADLRRSAAANIAASNIAADNATDNPAKDGAALPLQVPGATPNANAGRVRLAGSLPGASPTAPRTPVQMQLAVFAHGTQVFQATVLGDRVADDAAAVFFGSVRAGAAAMPRTPGTPGTAAPTPPPAAR